MRAVAGIVDAYLLLSARLIISAMLERTRLVVTRLKLVV